MCVLVMSYGVLRLLMPKLRMTLSTSGWGLIFSSSVVRCRHFPPGKLSTCVLGGMFEGCNLARLEAPIISVGWLMGDNFHVSFFWGGDKFLSWMVSLPGVGCVRRGMLLVVGW